MVKSTLQILEYLLEIVLFITVMRDCWSEFGNNFRSTLTNKIAQNNFQSTLANQIAQARMLPPIR